MSNDSFSVRFTVPRSAREVFAEILDVRGWWTGEIEGVTDRLGGEFVYRHGGLHESVQRITELVPEGRIVWRVIGANLSFVEPRDEWKGTDVVFALAPRDGGTEVHFTHVGLVPSLACWGACTKGWTYYLQKSLRARLERGAAAPSPAPAR